MFFWSLPAMKESFRRNSSQNFELTHPPLLHASWLHVTCRIVKRMKYRVLSKKWTENKAKVVLISVFFYYFRPKCDEFWPALNSAESEENSPEQLWNNSVSEKKTALFRENQRWNSSDSALIFLLWKFPVFSIFSDFFSFNKWNSFST